MVTMCAPEFCQGDDIRERGTGHGGGTGHADAAESDFADEFFERAHVS